MADEVIGLRVEVSDDGEIKSTATSMGEVRQQIEKTTAKAKSFKAEMREMTEQLLRMETAGKKGTAEFKALENRLALAKDTVGDMNERLKALDPNEKAKAFQALGSTMVGGFQAATGALAIFTGDNEQLQAILIRSMALVQGLQGIQALSDAKKQLAVVATILGLKKQAAAQHEVTVATQGTTTATVAGSTAFKGLRAVLISTGIGALVVGLGLIIANFEKITAFFKSNKIDAEKLRKEHEKMVAVHEANNSLILGAKDLEIRRAKATGATTAELRKMLREYEKMKTASAELSIEDAKRALVIEKAQLNQIKNEGILYRYKGWETRIFGASKEEIADQEARIVAATNAINTAMMELNKTKVETLELEAEFKKEDIAAKPKPKPVEEDKIKFKVPDGYPELDDLNNYLDAKQALEVAHDAEMDARYAEWKTKDDERKDKEKEARLQEIADAERLRDAKIFMAQQTLNAISALGELLFEDAEKQVKFKKTVAIAQVGIDLATSLSAIIAGASAAALAGGPAAPFLAAGYIAAGMAQVLGAFATVKGILKEAVLPSAPQLSATQQQAINGPASPAQFIVTTGQRDKIDVKTYILDSDLDVSDERRRRRGRLSRVG